MTFSQYKVDFLCDLLKSRTGENYVLKPFNIYFQYVTMLYIILTENGFRGFTGYLNFPDWFRFRNHHLCGGIVYLIHRFRSVFVRHRRVKGFNIEVFRVFHQALIYFGVGFIGVVFTGFCKVECREADICPEVNVYPTSFTTLVLLIVKNLRELVLKL